MDDKRRQEKREERRRRRVRSQVLAYSALTIVILALAAGIACSVLRLMKAGQGAGQKEQENQELIDEILASETEIPSLEPTPEPEPEVVEPTWEEKLDAYVDAIILEMPLEDKVAGLFVVIPEAITGVGAAVQAGDGTRQALESNPVGGIIYFKQNIKSEEQLKEMLANTAQYARYPLFLAVDEEGGVVSRIGSTIGTKMDGAGDIGATGDPENAYQAGLTIGASLAGLGFNLDFAPVADLANVEGSIMAGRAYGADAATASPFVTSMMRGLEEQNVTACLKHFPGIGSTAQDPHDGRAFSERTEEQFWAEELAVFQAGIDSGANMIMVSHMAAPALTGDNEPSVFSRVLVTDILRNQMGFQGVVITDALSMSAISEYYGAEEAAIMAVLAGCDMLLMPEDYGKAYQGVLEAVRNGNIDEERINDSLRRIYRIKYADMVE
ncbi:MAG: beta-N-acetylhexosaminidase [Lachnospiraceae bacterium]|uniref:glycoside hydrolase family 3 N-terminal domain-containing protein n=1 Tax=uncultured Acetatifactor sp. TaxID=1671927 RepID=UPI00262B5FB4|nr:glycoside hydrolase family 3 N-terminal domain-containing protein [uncultured Acetatifactor sp.]MCI8788177.1 beta-N-acetylhexosaminidase [Lachnospiraceae bacterium]